jgi:malonyl-CoA decarboxylase
MNQTTPVTQTDNSTASASAGLFNRTMQNIREVWRDVADRTSGIFAASPSPNLPEKDIEPIKTQIRDCLEGRGGEVSARSRAAGLGRTYLSLDAQGRKRFLQIIAHEFGVDRAAVNDAMTTLRKPELDAAGVIKAEQALRKALRPPWLRLLTQFNGLPEGVHFLVDLRAELLTFCKDDAALMALEGDLKQLLTTWFDVGFLELRRITWNSPAVLLEKLIAYEAVHAIQSWDDLKKRLDSDRRCFAFFHPRMPNEPLIFVEVALVDGMAANIQALLDEDAPVLDPSAANAAIFYSISNTQAGLAGISFGNFLIKRVVDGLTDEFKNLKTFATLSPIPGFQRWLDGKFAVSDQGADVEPELLLPAERKTLDNLNEKYIKKTAAKGTNRLKALLTLPDWYAKPEVAKVLKTPMMRLCAYYLAEEKRSRGIACDRVAHFHLSNGARIERLNWLANISSEGLAQSAGIMVNYRYKLSDIESNHESYTGEGRVNVSSSVKSLLRS